MAKDSRTLKLSILADVDNLNKNLKKASTDVDDFGGKLEKFGKVAAAAFAAAAVAAAAYATKIAIDGVKAAIEDEAAQVRLAGALERATGATRDQIAAVEQQITKTALATGVADDQLRPALARLAVSTGDTAKAQDLLNMALDIAQATGKPVESVANALAKAYDGNTTSLGKLGIGLSAAELKTMSFTEVQGKLSDLFGGAAAANAETFQGRMARLKVAFDEAKETIGFALLPIIERLVSFIVNQVVPNFEKFASAFDPIKEAIVENKDSFETLFNFIGDYVIPILTTLAGGALTVVGEVFGKIIGIIANAILKIEEFVIKVRDMVNKIIELYNRIPLAPNIGLLGGGGGFATGGAPGAVGGGGSTGGGGNVFVAPVVPGVVSRGGGSSGGGSGNQSALDKLTADAAKLADLVDTLTGANQPNYEAYAAAAMAREQAALQGVQGLTVNFNGIVGDGESVKRSLVELMNDSTARGTLGAGAFDR